MVATSLVKTYLNKQIVPARYRLHDVPFDLLVLEYCQSVVYQYGRVGRFEVRAEVWRRLLHVHCCDLERIEVIIISNLTLYLPINAGGSSTVFIMSTNTKSRVLLMLLGGIRSSSVNGPPLFSEFLDLVAALKARYKSYAVHINKHKIPVRRSS